MVTVCPYLTRMVLVYTCHPRVINVTPYHSWKDPGLVKKLYGHLVYGESCKRVSSEEKMKLENKVVTSWRDFWRMMLGSKCVALGSEENQGMSSRVRRECPQYAELTAFHVPVVLRQGLPAGGALPPVGMWQCLGTGLVVTARLGGCAPGI